MMNISHTGHFELDTPPEKALYLFTAPGEESWVPGWRPTIMSGDGFEAGTVFLTDDGKEETIWLVLNFDQEKHQARYARITPGSQAGTVAVQLSENESGGSVVQVTYELTALSESGNANLSEFNVDAYAEMLREWKELVEQSDIDYKSLVPTA